MATQTGAVPPPARDQPPARPHRGIDRVELGALVVLFLLSFWVLGLDLVRASQHNLVWTGTDGIFVVDQMQYLAWIRDITHHGLASNLFVLRHTTADYLQPGAELSALLVLLGIAPWLALLIWKPIALLCAFGAFRAYVHRTVPTRGARRYALVLTLFLGSLSVLYGSFGVVGDLMAVFLSWGYTFGLLAEALMVLAFLAYQRARDRGRGLLIPGVLGVLAGLLHPWQAELLIACVVGTEAVAWWLGGRRRPELRLPALTIALTAVALVYYFTLGHADLSWKLARESSRHHFALFPILLALAPLIIPAVFAWRPARITFLELITRVWPLVAVAEWALSGTDLGATPLHAFDGVTLPLAVLAVQGVARLPRLRRLPAARTMAIAATLLLTVPGTVYLMKYAADTAAPTTGNANFVTHDEDRALRFLARDPRPGGVLTRSYLGQTVPEQTGRRTFIGDCLWSEPHCTQRTDSAQALFDGTMAPATARAFVRSSGARFLLADCGLPNRLASTLHPLVLSVRRFGCAAVLELVPPSPPTGPLAESSLDAALRASWRQ